MSVDSHLNEIEDASFDEELKPPYLFCKPSIGSSPSIICVFLSNHEVSTRFAPTDISKRGFSTSSTAPFLNAPLVASTTLISAECISDTKHSDLTADPPTCSPSKFDVDQFSAPGLYLVNLTVPSSQPVAIQLDFGFASAEDWKTSGIMHKQWISLPWNCKWRFRGKIFFSPSGTKDLWT
uniref:Uncharacterized protein n=1 Tax=Opuntia streptacantha TaxID=393608 RepID=A0A7C9E6F0_OPUST